MLERFLHFYALPTFSLQLYAKYIKHLSVCQLVLKISLSFENTHTGDLCICSFLMQFNTDIRSADIINYFGPLGLLGSDFGSNMLSVILMDRLNPTETEFFLVLIVLYFQRFLFTNILFRKPSLNVCVRAVK